MEKDGKIITFGFGEETKLKAEVAFFDPTYLYNADMERDLMDNMLNLTEPSEDLTEDRVREIVREELLEFKLQYLRADTLFQRILSEIRRKKSDRRNPRK